jgi:alginate O-acetyltransferase complex protein AlgI
LIVSVSNILATYVFVCVCWVFFRAEDFDKAATIFYRIFVWDDGVIHIYSWSIAAVALLVAGTLFASAHYHKITSFGDGRDMAPYTASITGYYPELNLSRFIDLTLIFVVIGLILSLAYTGASPFIYFQF